MEYICDFTISCDSFIKPEYRTGSKEYLDMMRTYIWVDRERPILAPDASHHPARLLFRYPGATRGCIDIDTHNIITNIEFNQFPEDCYRKEAYTEIPKMWIGKNITEGGYFK